MIRQATFEDVPALLELGQRMQSESPTYGRYTPDYKVQYRLVMGIIQSPLHALFLTDDRRGAIVGHLSHTDWFRETAAEVDIFYVEPRARGGFAAFRLMQAFVTWAHDNGASEILAGATSGINPETADKFYTKLDFLPVGVLYKKEL